MAQQGNKSGGLTQELPVGRLVEEAQGLVSALGERALTQVADKAGAVTERLTDYADNGGDGSGLVGALTGGRSLLSGKSGMRSLLDAGVSQAKEKAKETVGQATDKVKEAIGGGNGGDGGKKIKVTNIVESIDVGVPVSLAYNQWTQFEDFPSFMKKVENVEQTSDTELDWKAQVFLSHRKWTSTVIEQVPDERIIWRSKADKGHVDGAVTFHEVTPDLTKIIMVLQYHPQGFFEHTGNLWRAQGRRARLELKHFQRQVMSNALLEPDEIEGWRGEVRDEEVVRSDEEVREEEREDEEDQAPQDEAGDEDSEDSEEPEADDGEDSEDSEEPEADDGEDSEDESDEDEDEDEEQATEEDAEDESDEDDTEPKSRSGKTGHRRSRTSGSKGR